MAIIPVHPQFKGHSITPNDIEDVIENVIEILKKIKWLKSEYSKKKLSKERRLKSFLKNEYFKVSLNEVSRDLRLSETL